MQSTGTYRVKVIYFIFLFSTFVLLLLYYRESLIVLDRLPLNITGSLFRIKATHEKYLVYGENCVIQNIDPFDKDVTKYYKPDKYFSCSKKELLSYISKTNGSVQLIIDEDIIDSYTSKNISCCYSYVNRVNNFQDPDSSIRYTKCKEFQGNVTLNENIVVVKCKIRDTKKQIYANVHAFSSIQPVQEKINSSPNIVHPLKILLIGIDSVSRLNLRRALPFTQKYLEHNKWIEYQGYNKIGDNTFPNLMAVFTGRNNTSAYNACKPKKVSGMDNCNLIWYDFRKSNFITIYAEDAGSISTFNYKKKGFTKLPTDFYFRPYILAAEAISKTSKYDMPYCAGPESSGERILNLIKDFSNTFKNQSTFGIFWMNTFSHNDNNSPSMMDTKLLEFLQEMEKDGTLENNIVIFLSDHGLRFGEFRYTKTGWYEERLPFIQFWIPQWFRNQYPDKYNNLQTNYNKLTTPYDLHMTLQDLLNMYNKNYTIVKSEGCNNCQSLFEDVPNSRSCEDVSIDPHYCTCSNFDPIDAKSEVARSVATFVLNEIELLINKSSIAKQCAKYFLKGIISASISKPRESFDTKSVKYMRLVIETSPKAVLEATIKLPNNVSDTKNYKLAGDISRLDTYFQHSGCVNDSELKKYCYCK